MDEHLQNNTITEDSHISVLGLENRTYKLLISNDIQCIKDLENYTLFEFWTLKRLGKRSFLDLQFKLKAFGIDLFKVLKMDDNENILIFQEWLEPNNGVTQNKKQSAKVVTKEIIEKILYDKYIEFERRLDYIELSMIEQLPPIKFIKQMYATNSMNDIWAIIESILIENGKTINPSLPKARRSFQNFDKCIFCGNHQVVKRFKKRYICQECIDSLRIKF